MDKVSTFQVVIGLLTLVSASSVLFFSNPVVSAMSLMATLFLTGALYFGMGFYFIGAVQILIYAGAISVLFVFIVMLLDLKRPRIAIPGRKLWQVLAALGSLPLFLGLGLFVLRPVRELLVAANANDSFAGAKAISNYFLSKYMIPFQVAGLLVLIAVMGAVVLGRPRVQKKGGP